MIYGIVSDLHLHNWSTFSGVDADGVNTRLGALLYEIQRAACAITAAGGRTMVVAGDVFHVRGSVAPSVLNPVLALFEELRARGLEIIIIAGNHDLEGDSATKLGSAITALSNIGCLCISEGPEVVNIEGMHKIGFIPWDKDIKSLKASIEGLRGKCDDLIIHAPIDGVIKGIPNAGLDPAWLGTLGFRYIFSGHYHNHKEFPNGVYSIGAIAHHSWGDVGSKAGYLLVKTHGDVTYQASHCPSFVELTSDMSEDDMTLEADGNYVRVRVGTSDTATIAGVRELLTGAGAKGVMVISEPPRATTERSATNLKKSMTMAESIAAFVDPTGADPDKHTLRVRCQEILAEAEAVE